MHDMRDELVVGPVPSRKSQPSTMPDYTASTLARHGRVSVQLTEAAHLTHGRLQCPTAMRKRVTYCV
jgi:hypothetical protein